MVACKRSLHHCGEGEGLHNLMGDPAKIAALILWLVQSQDPLEATND